MVRTVMVDNFSTKGITMETIENIVSFCPTSPMMRHNQIAVANRRLNVAWRRMFRAVLRVLLPANISLSALSTDDLRDVLGFENAGAQEPDAAAGAQEPGVAAPGPGAPQAAATPLPATDAPAGAAESPRAGERPGALADVAEHPPVCATCAGPTWQKCSGCQTAFLCAGCQADDRLGGREGCSMCRLIDARGWRRVYGTSSWTPATSS